MTTSAPAACPNCAQPTNGPYCSQCGQKTHIETPTLWEFIHEYLHHYVALDGALTRTLKLLVARPGELTAEFLAGRRQRYIKPLQLYLTISFIFFVTLGFLESHAPLKTKINISDASGQAHRTTERQAAASEPSNRGASNAMSIGTDLDRLPLLDSLSERAKKHEEAFDKNPEQTLRESMRQMVQRAPYAVFALMPIFAFLLWCMFRKRDLRYGTHLVFALHLHAFIFLLFLVALLPYVSGSLVWAVVFGYLMIALRRVYGGRWRAQLLRSAVLMLGYSVFALIAMMILVVTSFIL